MKFAGVLATALAALLLIAACGGDDDDTPSDEGGDTTPALTENDLAESMLLTPTDLLGDWDYSPPDDDDEPNPLDECDPGEPSGLTGKADGGDFSQHGTDTIWEDIRIFEDADALLASLEDTDEVADCVERIIEDGELDTDDAQYSNFAFQELDDPRDFGDETRAYRMSFHVVATNEDGDEEEGDVFLDLIYVAVDRYGFRISASEVFEPYPDDELADIVEIAEEKVRSVLGGDSDDDDRASPTPDEDETEPPVEDDEPPSGAGSSQEDPVPFGDSGVINGRADVRVLTVEFDAEEIVLAEDSTNVATADKNMVLMKIEITNVGDEDLDVFFDLFYNLIGDKGTPYNEFDPSCGLVPDEIEGVLETGESTEGSVCVQADEDDSDLVLLLEMFGDDVDEEVLYLALE
ncbi:MAG: hypothetical protein WD904_10880 [Dehalococcoidia bacterium]